MLRRIELSAQVLYSSWDHPYGQVVCSRASVVVTAAAVVVFVVVARACAKAASGINPGTLQKIRLI